MTMQDAGPSECHRAARHGPHLLPRARRRLLAALLGALALPRLAGCAAVAGAAAPPWQARLRGDTIALLGEVHDNPTLHRLRAEALRRAVEAGWRPVLVMEQFDIDRQDDIERGRREHPRDARALIAAAGAPRGWDWAYYEPLVALALAHDLPLVAGNLSRTAATRVMREGPAAVLGEARARALGLLDPVDPALLAAQERAIDLGHCGALPGALLPAMARAQFARDAVMAGLLREHAGGGAVLLAGDGHVRRDLGVPRWLGGVAPERLLSVGFVETGQPALDGRYDALVVAAPPKRDDPCRDFVAPRAVAVVSAAQADRATSPMRSPDEADRHASR